MEASTCDTKLTDQTSLKLQSKNLGACMKELYGGNLWTDVNFRCKDHDEEELIHAHKIILAARSPVFQEMFYGASVGHNDEVELPDVTKKTFDLFLRYLYSETVALEEKTVPDVLRVAQVYKVSNLLQFCSDYLATVITTDNACRILNLALLYTSTSLQDACCIYIDQNAEKILNSDGFTELSENALLHILKGNTFYASEDAIFTKAEEWAIKRVEESRLERNGANIRKVLDISFYHLRCPTMAYQILMKCTRNKGYFSVEEYLDMADFINGIHDTQVLSNSCVARVPVTEILMLNNENREETLINQIYCSFEISVSKDTELISFSLGYIAPYLEFIPRNYQPMGNWKGIDTTQTSMVKFFSEYSGKVVAVHYTRDGIKATSNVRTCDELSGRDFTKNLHLSLRGSLFCDSLDLKHDFTLYSSRNKNEQIDLKQPVILKIYRFSIHINIQYYENDIKMKIRCSTIHDTATSKSGHVKVSATGPFKRIKSIEIKNYSNREKDV